MVVPSIFLSHAHEDKPLARTLTAGLIRRGYRVWLDEVELRIGDSLVERIAEAITEGDFVLAIVSPDSLESNWCQQELAWAATKGIDRKRVVVLPIRCRGAEMPALLVDKLWADADASSVDDLADRIARDIERHQGDSSIVMTSAPAVPEPWPPPPPSGAEALQPLLVLAPPSQHRLNEPHEVTPPPQVIWAQTAFVDVENVGSAVAFIRTRSAGADQGGVGPITVRPPAAVAAGTARPVELVVSTMSREVRVHAGQQFRFWLDYGSGAEPDRRLWAVARYNGGGGWENVGFENRSLEHPDQGVP